MKVLDMEFPKKQFKNIKKLANDLNLKIILWRSYDKWFKLAVGWNEIPFKDINKDEIQEITE